MCKNHRIHDTSFTGTPVPIHRCDINTKKMKCHSTVCYKMCAERRMENKCKLYLEATQFITEAKVVICSILYKCNVARRPYSNFAITAINFNIDTLGRIEIKLEIMFLDNVEV